MKLITFRYEAVRMTNFFVGVNKSPKCCWQRRISLSILAGIVSPACWPNPNYLPVFFFLFFFRVCVLTELKHIFLTWLRTEKLIPIASRTRNAQGSYYTCMSTFQTLKFTPQVATSETWKYFVLTWTLHFWAPLLQVCVFFFNSCSFVDCLPAYLPPLSIAFYIIVYLFKNRVLELKQ